MRRTNLRRCSPGLVMVMIVLMLPLVTLWSGACQCVCQRWKQLMESAPIVSRKQNGLWAAYEAGVIEPHTLEGHTGGVLALATGLNAVVYSGSTDRTIRVWSSESGAHLQTLDGVAQALAVGLDGKICSSCGLHDAAVRMWSALSGAHLQTLDGYTDTKHALAVGLHGKVYSGSWEKNCPFVVWRRWCPRADACGAHR